MSKRYNTPPYPPPSLAFEVKGRVSPRRRDAAFIPCVQRIFVITGTDTGVGKTVFTRLLAAHLHTLGARVAALKPVCSGGRDDARQLRRAIGGVLPLGVINPWFFRAPLTPLLAARAEGRRLELSEVVAQIRRVAAAKHEPEFVLVEGAGGLLSPLGEGFSTRELVVALRAETILVAANRLGAINHVRLTLAALPRGFAARTRIVLMNPARPDHVSRTNAGLIEELTGAGRTMTFPHLPAGSWTGGGLRGQARRCVADALAAIVAG